VKAHPPQSSGETARRPPLQPGYRRAGTMSKNPLHANVVVPDVGQVVFVQEGLAGPRAETDETNLTACRGR
jgi:hypothetical protein